ncbi:MAG: hypothetical protein KHZ83_03845 [Roseburia sp.]|nr:hypothetical protein [Roseburia sp.]
MTVLFRSTVKGERRCSLYYQGIQSLCSVFCAIVAQDDGIIPQPTVMKKVT